MEEIGHRHSKWPLAFKMTMLLKSVWDISDIVSLPVTFLTSPRRLHCMLNADSVRFVGEMGTL